MRKLGSLIVALTALSTGGCASNYYRSTEEGEITGRLTVEWIAPDCFAYRPDALDGLSFQDSTGRTITPETIFTDGGSIPRLLWGIPQLSPWGYAPAYIVHDWMFEAHRCEKEDYTFEDSVRVLSEVIKTLMESERWGVARDKLALYAISKAVGSPIAKGLWNRGKCNAACADIDPDLMDGGGTVLFELDFSEPGDG